MQVGKQAVGVGVGDAGQHHQRAAGGEHQHAAAAQAQKGSGEPGRGADPAGGMTRVLYSPEWLETQQQFKKRMAASGLETRFDEVGNLYGRLNGTEYPQEVVLSGSHIDTVVNGGNLDGQFGALAAWLAIDWLKTQYGAPLRTVEVVAMAEEEGSRFPYVFWGSKNIFGLANPDDVRNISDAKGTRFVDAMKA